MFKLTPINSCIDSVNIKPIILYHKDRHYRMTCTQNTISTDSYMHSQAAKSGLPCRMKKKIQFFLNYTYMEQFLIYLILSMLCLTLGFKNAFSSLHVRKVCGNFAMLLIRFNRLVSFINLRN